MTFNIEPSVIDVIVCLYIGINLFLGYRAGLFARLYDFLSTILIFIGAFALASPLANNITFYSGKDNVITMIASSVINVIIAFFVALVVLWIIKIILGLLLKPLFRKLKDSTHITHLIGGLLGMAFSFLKSLVVCYLILGIAIPTFTTNGSEVINETQVASQVVPLASTFGSQFPLLNDSKLLKGQSSISNKKVLDAIMHTSLSLNSYGLLKDESMISFINSDLGDDIMKYGCDLTYKQKEQFNGLLAQSNFTIAKRQSILSKITESDE
jgi:uncharacterized membrane protein required for colicin V production